MPDLSYPPLKSWIVSGGIFISLLLVIHVLALKYNDSFLNQRYTAEANYLLQHALKNSKNQSSQQQVVILGSSLVGQGVSCSEELADSGYQKIAVSKIFLNANADLMLYFQQAGVFDSLLLHPPKILLIEVDQLTYKVNEPRTWKDEWSRGAIFLNNIKTTLAFELGKYRMPEYCGKIINGSLSDSSISYVDRDVRVFNQQSRLSLYWKKLNDAGVKLVAIHIPRPAVTEKRLHKGLKEKQYQALIHRYSEKYNMSYWHYPELLSFQYFYDQGHLNDQGRKKYSEWLYRKIVQVQ